MHCLRFGERVGRNVFDTEHLVSKSIRRGPQDGQIPSLHKNQQRSTPTILIMRLTFFAAPLLLATSSLAEIRECTMKLPSHRSRSELIPSPAFIRRQMA